MSIMLSLCLQVKSITLMQRIRALPGTEAARATRAQKSSRFIFELELIDV